MQLWRHKHWNMTSLTLFQHVLAILCNVFKPLNALYLQHTLSTYATLTWAQKCNQLFLNIARNSFTSKYKYDMHKAKEDPHITSSDRGERGFVARFTFSSYTIWRSKLHYFRQNYTTMKTCLWITWNSNRLLKGDSRSTASLGLITRFMRLIATVRRLRHWNFHSLSFWLAISLLCDVSYVTVNETFSW